MAKIFIYKDYDLIEELNKIWRIPTSYNSRKDKEILKLIEIIEKSVEVMVKRDGNKNNKRT